MSVPLAVTVRVTASPGVSSWPIGGLSVWVGAARLAAIPAGASPASIGVQSMLELYPATVRATDPSKAWK